MDIQGERILAVPRAEAWRALNDPAVLQRCLPGCDTFEPDGENRYRVAMQASVGPVRARFAGKLQLRDVVPPASYALAFEGSGGVAGFGKGSAQVTLDDVSEGTRLRYVAKAQVGGRLAQVGARLIDGVTKRMADDFFARFVNELAVATPARPEPVATGGSQPTGNAAHAMEVASPPAGLAVPAARTTRDATQIAVIAAAVAATAAAVAVLAAVVAMGAAG